MQTRRTAFALLLVALLLLPIGAATALPAAGFEAQSKPAYYEPRRGDAKGALAVNRNFEQEAARRAFAVGGYGGTAFYGSGEIVITVHTGGRAVTERRLLEMREAAATAVVGQGVDIVFNIVNASNKPMEWLFTVDGWLPLQRNWVLERGPFELAPLPLDEVGS